MLLGLALAQALSGPPADAKQLARIRKALAEPPAISVPLTASREGFVFRITVHAPQPKKPIWDDWSNVPSYIRPNMPLYHYDFMQQVTPEEFRAGTFATVGLPVGQLLELTRLERCADGAELLPELRPQDGKIRLDAQLGCLHLAELDLLHA